MNLESIDKDLNETPSSEVDLYDLGIREDDKNVAIRDTIQQQAQQDGIDREDPRERPDGGGVAGIAKEIQSALSGGLQDTASS